MNQHVSVIADQLSVQILGKGCSEVPLIILHGWGNSLKEMQPLGELLKHYAEVHLVDLPGFGRSPHPEAVWSSFDYADCLFDYLKLHQIDKISLLGHSFGGKVAMSFAAKYPEKLEKLILIAPSGLKRHRTFSDKVRLKSIKYLASITKFIDRKCSTKLFEKHFSKKFGSTDYKNAGKMRPILVKSVNEDLTNEVQKIKAPTLLLWGKEDVETPPEIAARLHQLLQSSSLYIFPGKGHHLYSDAGAHLCAAYIKPFLLRGTNG